MPVNCPKEGSREDFMSTKISDVTQSQFWNNVFFSLRPQFSLGPSLWYFGASDKQDFYEYGKYVRFYQNTSMLQKQEAKN